MKNKILKAKFTFVGLLIFVIFSVYLNASTDFLSGSDYLQSVTQQMTKNDIDNFYSDLGNISPMIKHNMEQVIRLFGGENNFVAFNDHVMYALCILLDPSTDTKKYLEKMQRCRTSHADAIVNLTHIIQKILENSDDEAYAEMKDFADAVVRIHNFLSKHRKLFPEIDAVFILLSPEAISVFADQLSYVDYRTMFIAEETQKDIANFNSDYRNIMSPMYDNNYDRIFSLFGDYKNHSDFYAYMLYGLCMLSISNLHEEIVVKRTIECGNFYAYQLVDITSVIQKVHENSVKKEYADMKDFADAVVRAHNFFIKYKIIFPAINAISTSSYRVEL